MELVIKIPDETYQNIQKRSTEVQAKGDVLENAVLNGTPLNEGHGELKDFQKIYADMLELLELARQQVIDTPTNSPYYMRYVTQLGERTAFKQMLFNAPIIIEADIESENRE